MADEYIEKATDLAICEKEYQERIRMSDWCGDTVAWNIWHEIKAIPAADVAPVRHGRWHSRFYYRESTKAYDCEMHVCSECGSEWSYDAETGSSDFNYCPNCWAKMDGGDTSERQAMAFQSQND